MLRALYFGPGESCRPQDNTLVSRGWLHGPDAAGTAGCGHPLRGFGRMMRLLNDRLGRGFLDAVAAVAPKAVPACEQLAGLQR